MRKFISSRLYVQFAYRLWLHSDGTGVHDFGSISRYGRRIGHRKKGHAAAIEI